MRFNQHVKTALAVAFALGMLAAASASAHTGQSVWVVRPNPDEQAAQLARAVVAAPASSSWVVRPNPDQQAAQLAPATAERPASSSWVVRPNSDEHPAWRPRDDRARDQPRRRI
jgi:hypothetical protein